MSATPAVQDQPRKVIVERTAYRPGLPVEQFIVPLLRDELDGLLARHTPARPGRALDVGCGGQPFRELLTRLGYAYSSMDVHQQPGVSVDYIGPIDGPLALDPGEYGAFDLILITEVMEHVADWATAFDNLATLLAPGGRVVLTAPFFYPLHEEPYDFWRPTPHAVRYHAQRVGLDVTQLYGAGTPTDVLGTLLGASVVRARSRGLFSRGVAFAVERMRRVLFWALRRRLFGSRIELLPLYKIHHSTVAVLTKPAAGDRP